jgi:hypothetical protein
MARSVSLGRRGLLFGFSLLPFAGVASGSEDIVDLDWSDLLPEAAEAPRGLLRGLIQHSDGARLDASPIPAGVRSDWNDRVVRIPGYLLPLEYAGTGVTAFILVPYIGACIHVPPPPPNQLIFVTTSKPYESQGLFEPVTVTGLFGTASTSTQLADIGYALSADLVEPYRG